MIYILFSGQSNCVGQGTGGTWDISPLVKVWNNETNRIDLEGLGNAWVTPDRNAAPFFNGCNNQGVQAANYLARLTGRQVRLIIVGRGGESIKQWHNSLVTGPMYARLKSILQQADVDCIDWFLWNQGSADNGYADYYAAKWNALLTQMQADDIIGSSTPVVLSETAFLTPEINTALREIAAADSRCALAQIGTLPTYDTVHFTGTALVQAGWESVYALQKVSSLCPSFGGGGKFVYATGAAGVTFDPGVASSVPLMPRYGDLDMVVDGHFKARHPGLHQFTVSAYCAGWGTKLQLKDGDGAWLATIAASGNEDPFGNNAMLHGEIVLNLPPETVVRVCVSHAATTPRTIPAAHSAGYNRLLVKVLN